MRPPVARDARDGRESTASERFRAACDPIWRALHAHPFIREMAAGTLPLDTFRFFLEQDIMYLQDFARTLAMGAAKSRSEDELRYFASLLAVTMDAELPNNRSLLQTVTGMGAEDRGGSNEMAPANLAYTSFLLSLGHRGGPLAILAAVLPCAWSYCEIAAALPQADERHTIYGNWIGFYRTDAVVDSVRGMRNDFDAMVEAEHLSPGRLDDLAQIFATSLRLEGAFWEMAYTFERWPDRGGAGSPARRTPLGDDPDGGRVDQDEGPLVL